VTVRSKLLLAQLPLVIALFLVGFASRATVNRLAESSQQILKNNHLSVLYANAMRDAADVLARARPTTNAAKQREIFERNLRQQEANITEPGEREMTVRLRAAWEAFQRELDSGNGGNRETLESLVIEIEKHTNEVAAVNQDAMVQKSERARRLAESMSGVLLAVTIASCILGILASVLITNRLTRPLSVLSQAVRRLAQGDLAARVRLDTHDEIGNVARELNTMAQRLADYRSSSLGELLQAQQAAQSAIDSLPDPVLVLELGGGLTAANQAANNLFNVDTDAVGDEVWRRTPSEVTALIESMREDVRAGREAFQPKSLDEAFPITLRDGQHYFLARGTPVANEQGVIVGFTLLFQDVTKLRRFDELKTDLVATVAHEFRTPLTSLRMAIHLCTEGTVGALNPKQADLLFAAREDCERLQVIVDDLLDLSRIQAGRVELHTRSVSSASLLEDSLNEFRQHALDRSIQLEMSPLTVDKSVKADPERIRLVLANLLSNAIRHTPAHGTISLRAAPDGNFVRFEVADTGPGIPPEFQGRLFERFFRVPGAPQGGAGFGLYICKELVEAHNGRIGLESDPGIGSIFWFTLPAA
jgi:signal transduction histidine kinase